jgi:hypothetical protein
MAYVRSAFLLAAAVVCGGCFQFSTVLTLKADGSGTIDQRMLFTQAGIAQLRTLTALGGGQEFDPVSEQQARDAAKALGGGVTYVSSTPIDSPDGVGRETRYAFADINQLRLDRAAGPAAGVPPPTAGSDVTFSLARQPNGNAVLRIAMPVLPIGGAAAATPNATEPSAEQLALLKPMLAGARLSIVVEPAGRIVRTNSPHVAGQRITLLEADVDALLDDPALMQRLQAASTPVELKALLTDVSGLKVTLDPEVTIEFEP